LRLKNLIRKYNIGFVISFIGTDGSGKSTIIESIKPSLKKKFNQGVYYEHLRPNKFPSIASLFGRSESFQETVVDPHRSSQSGFLVSLIRWSYYMLDYTLGFYIKVFPKVKACSCIWIFDRYYYDYFIDPMRLRVKLPKAILKFGQFLIPEPDIIICLGTDPEIIHKRKPELPYDEVKRQVKELKMFCTNHKRSIWIDTGKSIETSSSEAFEAIMLCYNNKNKQV
jgi:thymidylate kinase